MEDLGHWTTIQQIPENAFGFIYIITNISTNKKYIAKKQMVSNIKRKPFKFLGS